MATVATSPPPGKRGQEFLSLDEVTARYSGVYSRWNIRERARRGELPSLKHPGAKAVIYPAAWLDAWDNGAELETRIVRRRGLTPGRICRPVVKP